MESPSKALRGNKEMTNDHTNEYDSKMARDSGGDSVPLQSERGLDHTTNSQSLKCRWFFGRVFSFPLVEKKFV